MTIFIPLWLLWSLLILVSAAIIYFIGLCAYIGFMVLFGGR